MKFWKTAVSTQSSSTAQEGLAGFVALEITGYPSCPGIGSKSIAVAWLGNGFGATSPPSIKPLVRWRSLSLPMTLIQGARNLTNTEDRRVSQGEGRRFLRRPKQIDLRREPAASPCDLKIGFSIAARKRSLSRQRTMTSAVRSFRLSSAEGRCRPIATSRSDARLKVEWASLR